MEFRDESSFIKTSKKSNMYVSSEEDTMMLEDRHVYEEENYSVKQHLTSLHNIGQHICMHLTRLRTFSFFQTINQHK